MERGFGCNCEPDWFNDQCNDHVLKGGYTVSLTCHKTGGLLAVGPDGLVHVAPPLSAWNTSQPLGAAARGGAVPAAARWKVFPADLTLDFIRFSKDVLLSSNLTGNFLRQIHGRYLSALLPGAPAEGDPNAVFWLGVGASGDPNTYGVENHADVELHMYDGGVNGHGKSTTDAAGANVGRLAMVADSDTTFYVDILSVDQHLPTAKGPAG